MVFTHKLIYIDFMIICPTFELENDAVATPLAKVQDIVDPEFKLAYTKWVADPPVVVLMSNIYEDAVGVLTLRFMKLAFVDDPK